MDAIDAIRDLRRHGLSQQTIAHRTGLSQGAISHIETGRRKNVFATTRDRLLALHAEICGGGSSQIGTPPTDRSGEGI